MTIKTPSRFPSDWVPAASADPAALTSVEEDGVRWFRDVEYARIRGYRLLLLDLSIPASDRPPVALVVLVHGGAWLGGSKNVCPGDLGDYPRLRPAQQDGQLQHPTDQQMHHRQDHGWDADAAPKPRSTL